MLMTVIKYSFLIISCIFALMVVYGKLFVFKKKRPSFVSDYCALLALFLASYSILAFCLAGLLPDSSTKVIMFCFGISPFVLGLLATYHTEKYYTFLQVMLILCGIYYII